MTRNDIEVIFSRYLDDVFAPRPARLRLVSSKHTRRLELRHKRCNICLMPFMECALEALRALFGEVNGSLFSIKRLQAWQFALNGTEEGALKIGLGFELVEPALKLALMNSYNLKQLFVFLGTKLLILSRTLSGGTVPAKLPEDHRIDLATLDTWCDRSNPKHVAFVKAVKTLDSGTHWDMTRNYRRKAVHQLAPHLMLGLRMSVQVSKNNGGYAYEVGVSSPVTLDQVLPALVEEHAKQRTAFAAFLRFVFAEWDDLQIAHPLNGGSYCEWDD